MTANVTFFHDVARTNENGRIVLPPAVLGLRNFEPNSEVPLFFTEFGVELLSPERLEGLAPALGSDGEPSTAADPDHFDAAGGHPFPDDLPDPLSADT
jgi:hypothetical protein